MNRENHNSCGRNVSLQTLSISNFSIISSIDFLSSWTSLSLPHPLWILLIYFDHSGEKKYEKRSHSHGQTWHHWPPFSWSSIHLHLLSADLYKPMATLHTKVFFCLHEVIEKCISLINPILRIVSSKFASQLPLFSCLLISTSIYGYFLHFSGMSSTPSTLAKKNHNFWIELIKHHWVELMLFLPN